MLKKSLFLVLLAMAACTCGKKDFAERPSVTLPPIADGEFLTYRVMAGGDSVGTMATLFAHDNIKDVPAFVHVQFTRVRIGNIETTDSSVVYMGRNHLNPLSSFRFVRKGENLVTTAANYGEKSIAVSTYGNQGEKQRLLPIDLKTFDTDQLTLLCRALKVEPGKTTELNIVNSMGPPAGGAIYGGVFSSLADETVTVPAGSFDCRGLKLVVGESPVEMWYEKAGTGRMVLYKSPQVSMELLPAEPGKSIMTRKVQPE
jgi:hypothetical protein